MSNEEQRSRLNDCKIVRPSLQAALDNYFEVVDYGEDEQIFRAGLAEGLSLALRDLVGFSHLYSREKHEADGRTWTYNQTEWDAAGTVIDALLANGIDVRRLRDGGEKAEMNSPTAP